MKYLIPLEDVHATSRNIHTRRNKPTYCDVTSQVLRIFIFDVKYAHFATLDVRNVLVRIIYNVFIGRLGILDLFPSMFVGPIKKLVLSTVFFVGYIHIWRCGSCDFRNDNWTDFINFYNCDGNENIISENLNTYCWNNLLTLVSLDVCGHESTNHIIRNQVNNKLSRLEFEGSLTSELYAVILYVCELTCNCIFVYFLKWQFILN